jgi:hypothetical protein
MYTERANLGYILGYMTIFCFAVSALKLNTFLGFRFQTDAARERQRSKIESKSHTFLADRQMRMPFPLSKLRCGSGCLCARGRCCRWYSHGHQIYSLVCGCRPKRIADVIITGVGPNAPRPRGAREDSTRQSWLRPRYRRLILRFRPCPS